MSTINKDEIEKFSRLADEWWDIEGKFKPLHMFNPVRIEYILDICSSYFKFNNDKKLPLKGLKILDIGCGGGLISEPMSRLGAEVVGIDASEKNIIVASLHAKKSNLKIIYLKKSPEQMNKYNEFDSGSVITLLNHIKHASSNVSSKQKSKANEINIIDTLKV